MPKIILTDVRLFAGGVDLSGNTNKVELSAEAEEKETTNYRSGGWNEFLGGIASATFSAEGQWEAGDPSQVDNATWAQLGALGPWTVTPEEASVGSLSYTTLVLRNNMNILGTVGDVAPWTSNGSSSWPLARGQIAHALSTPITAPGTGTALNLGTIASRSRLYGSLHVISAAGTTPELSMTVETDSVSDFTADPTTVLTFDTADSLGGQILRTNGDPITGPWYRVNFTVSGTDPSFLAVVALGTY